MRQARSSSVGFGIGCGELEDARLPDGEFLFEHATAMEGLQVAPTAPCSME